MKFSTRLREIQKMAWDTEYHVIDYGLINDAEYEAEHKMREFASDNDIDGSDLVVWEDGIKTSNDLSDDDIHKLENVYLEAYEKYFLDIQ